MPMFARLLGTDRAEKHPSLPSTFGIESLIDGRGKKAYLAALPDFIGKRSCAKGSIAT